MEILKKKIDHENFKININMEIRCELIKKSMKHDETNFSVSAGMFNNSKLFESINGPANEVYVTRKQLSRFAGQNLYKMVVYNEDDTDQHERFSQEFIKQIMDTLNQQFQKLNNLEDLQKLSTYEFSEDFKANFEGKIKSKKMEETQKQNQSSNSSNDKNKKTTNSAISGSTNGTKIFLLNFYFIIFHIIFSIKIVIYKRFTDL